MTGAHSRINQHPIRSAVMAAGMAASLLLLAGLFVTSLVLMATHSKYLQIVVIAFQSTIAVWFRRHASGQDAAGPHTLAGGPG